MKSILELPLDEKGVALPIYATFTGHKRLPMWAVATNSLNHKLRFFETEVELKVIKTHRLKWSDVKSVDAQIIWKTHNLTLNFKRTPWNFSANVILPRYLRESLAFLNSKGLNLTPRARQIMESITP
ncbi:MAG TPA: hypothetical protein VGB45_01645 [Abditibacterium sp.]|jgi:hypothetical protein